MKSGSFSAVARNLGRTHRAVSAARSLLYVHHHITTGKLVDFKFDEDVILQL